jgi:hypothetical protein
MGALMSSRLALLLLPSESEVVARGGSITAQSGGRRRFLRVLALRPKPITTSEAVASLGGSVPTVRAALRRLAANACRRGRPDGCPPAKCNPFESTGRRMNPAQRLPQQIFQARRPKLRVALQLGEHGSDLSLAKAEVAERREDLGVSADDLGRAGGADRAPIRAAVGVAKANLSVTAPLEVELTAVSGPVVAPTKRQKVLGVVLSAFGPRHEVVNVDEAALRAAGHPAAPLVPRENGAT